MTGNWPARWAAVLAIAGSAAPAHASAPRIDDISWYRVDAHCTFSRSDHKISKDDPKSWRFVLLVDRSQDDSRASIETAYMKIDGTLRELRFENQSVGTESEIRRYMTYGDDPVRVEITLKQGKRSSKSMSYSGTITAIRDQAVAELDVKGNCR
jgi:hypothetical protein